MDVEGIAIIWYYTSFARYFFFLKILERWRKSQAWASYLAYFFFSFSLIYKILRLATDISSTRWFFRYWQNQRIHKVYGKLAGSTAIPFVISLLLFASLLFMLLNLLSSINNRVEIVPCKNSVTLRLPEFFKTGNFKIFYIFWDCVATIFHIKSSIALRVSRIS